MMYQQEKESAPAATGAHNPNPNAAYYNAYNNAGKKDNTLTRQESQAEIEAIILHKILNGAEIAAKLIKFLEPEDFTLPFHKGLLKTLKMFQAGKEIDVYSIAQKMGMKSPYILNNLVDLATMDVFVFDSTIVDLAKKLKEQKLRKRISYLKLEEIKEEIEKIEEIDREEDDLFVDFQEEEIKEEKFLFTLKEDPKSGWPLATSALFAAKGGVGKSHLAVQLACCLALQEKILFLVPQRRVKSLIFNFEDDNGHDTARMLIAMSRYIAEKHSATQDEILGYLKEDVLIANANLKRLLKDCFVQKGRDVELDTEKIHKIIDICKKNEIELVVIDAIVHLINARDHARMYMDFCTRLNQAGINILNLSHLNKNSKATLEEKIYGGVELVNLHRFVTLLDFNDKDENYFVKIIKANKVKRIYQNKPYLCKRNNTYWQILESVEDYSTKKATTKKNTTKERKKKKNIKELTNEEITKLL